MIYVTFEPYTNRKGKKGETNRIFKGANAKAKAIAYANARGNCTLKVHTGRFTDV